MKSLRLLLILLCIAPLSASAASGMLDPAATVDQLTLLINQYNTRIKSLESENAILKNEMVKANIKIPLTDFSGATAVPLPTKTTNSGSLALPAQQTSTTPTANTSASKTEKDFFIDRIHTDWTAIQKAYSLPADSRIGWYEFVQSGALDHVFVDLVYGATAGSGGVYDAKILYQYEKKEYKRKLIGFFLYDPKIEKYITKTGANPFGGSVRIFVPDPLYKGMVNTPNTVTPAKSGSGVSTTATVSTSPVTATSTNILDISKAYTEKRYLTTISLSKSYLATNPPNAEVLSILYRTYFIIGKYSDSLATLAKLEALGPLDGQTACNAKVVATYGNNTALVTKYNAMCPKK